jgi:hypothetical protein
MVILYYVHYRSIKMPQTEQNKIHVISLPLASVYSGQEAGSRKQFTSSMCPSSLVLVLQSAHASSREQY